MTCVTTSWYHVWYVVSDMWPVSLPLGAIGCFVVSDMWPVSLPLGAMVW